MKKRYDGETLGRKRKMVLINKVASYCIFFYFLLGPYFKSKNMCFNGQQIFVQTIIHFSVYREPSYIVKLCFSTTTFNTQPYSQRRFCFVFVLFLISKNILHSMYVCMKSKVVFNNGILHKYDYLLRNTLYVSDFPSFIMRLEATSTTFLTHIFALFDSFRFTLQSFSVLLPTYAISSNYLCTASISVSLPYPWHLLKLPL